MSLVPAFLKQIMELLLVDEAMLHVWIALIGQWPFSQIAGRSACNTLCLPQVVVFLCSRAI